MKAMTSSGKGLAVVWTVLACASVAIAQGGGGFSGGGFGGSGQMGGGGVASDRMENLDARISTYLSGEETRSILTPGEFTEWTLELKAGQVVIAEARSDFFDPAIEIVDDKDKVLAFNDDRYPGDQRPLLLWRCTKDGTYRMHGRCFRDKAGGQMFMRYRTYGSVDLKPGGRAEFVPDASNRFLIRLSLKAGQIVDVFSAGSNPRRSFTQVAEVSPTGLPCPRFLNEFDPVLTRTVYAPIDGDYYVVGDAFGEDGTRLQVGSRESVPTSLPREGGAARSKGKSDELQVWSVKVKAGEVLRVATPSLAPSTTIIVAPKPMVAAYDPKKPETSPFNPQAANARTRGSVVTRSMPGRDRDGRIAVVWAFQDTELWIAVQPSARSADSYELTVDEATEPFPANVDRKSALKVGGYDYWDFDAKVGEVVSVRSTFDEFAEQAVLYGPDGNAIWHASADVDETKIERTFVVTKPGKYVVGVSGSGGSGAYRLSRTVAAVKTITKKSPAKGDSGTGIQVWKFTVKPNDPILLHWRSTKWDYQILVCDEQGRTRTLPLQLVDGSHRYSVLSATEPQEYVVVLIPGPDGLLSDYLIELLDLPGRRDGS